MAKEISKQANITEKELKDMMMSYDYVIKNLNSKISRLKVREHSIASFFSAPSNEIFHFNFSVTKRQVEQCNFDLIDYLFKDMKEQFKQSLNEVKR